MGNGPYRYARHVPQTMIELEANPDFYRGKPKNERVVLIRPGTKVTWSGNFNFHPLTGGVSPVTDFLSPISSAVDLGGSVVLNNEDDYPYFCEIHNNTMTGVIYVLASLPAEFSKNSPANGATGLSATTSLSWSESAGVTVYEYCIDTTDNDACDTSWISSGTNTSASPEGLSQDTEHFWQTRAINPLGNTEANSGSWWSFRTSALTEVIFEDGFEPMSL